jgi:predicted transglutaminase-like cysteine proteinase
MPEPAFPHRRPNLARLAILATMAAGVAGCGATTEGRLVDAGKPSPPPAAYTVYCGEFGAADPGCALSMTPVVAAELRRINAEINARITPASDQEAFGWGDRWVVIPGAGRGDCDDYAVTKLHALLALGWPRDALRLTLAEIVGEGPHLVLAVRTTAGDLILDNRSNRVSGPPDGYRWLLQEVPGKRHWTAVALAGARSAD